MMIEILKELSPVAHEVVDDRIDSTVCLEVDLSKMVTDVDI